MASPGLRERKKAGTRRLIADVAGRLFAERGYEQVAVSDVAREAEISEQTVYNYFRTKEQLVIDRDQQIQDRLVDLIRTRAPGIGAAAAIRDFVLASVDGIPSISPEIWRGELGHLAFVSPTVHRLSLEMTNRQGDAIAAAISDTTPVPTEVAKLQGIAVASVFQIIISHAGRRTHEGRSQTAPTSCTPSSKPFWTNWIAGSVSPNTRLSTDRPGREIVAPASSTPATRHPRANR